MENLDSPIPADEALARLKAGNERFVQGRPTGLSDFRYSVSDLSAGQRPFATILGCSDSRVPPELLFDVGLGELFVVRVAGNVFSREVAGSLQYAGAHLHTALFVVMGHKGCGAVGAALDSIENETPHHSHIQMLVDSILPAVSGLDHELSAADQLEQAVERNVRWTVHQIMEMPEAQAREAEGIYKIVGAIYDIDTGHVKFLT